MLGLSPGIKMTILSKSGHSIFVLSTIDIQRVNNKRNVNLQFLARTVFEAPRFFHPAQTRRTFFLL